MVLEGGLDWKALGISPRDMDFVEAKNAAAREIALAFGVPPMLLGIPGDNTYSNLMEANRALWRQTIVPLVRRVADERPCGWPRLRRTRGAGTGFRRRRGAGRGPGEQVGEGGERRVPQRRGETATGGGGGVGPVKTPDLQAGICVGRFSAAPCLAGPTAGFTAQISPRSTARPTRKPNWWAVDRRWKLGEASRNGTHLRSGAGGITKHAINQIINRGVSPAAILDALSNPIVVRPRLNMTTQYIGARATVVLNGYGGIVTVWGR